MKPRVETTLKRQIREDFPQVHRVDVDDVDNLLVSIRAIPSEDVCPIAISRIVASQTYPRSYTLRIEYGWVGRLKSLTRTKRGVIAKMNED